MTLQRQVTPLPLGVYWLDIPEVEQASFNMWIQISPGVVVLKTVKEDEFEWVLFEVRAPTDLPEQFGFPNIAEKGRETNREDTERGPPPEPDPFEELPDIKDIKKGISTTLVLVGVGIAAAIYLSRKR